MQRLRSFVHVMSSDDTGNADFRRGNHINVDFIFRQRFKHFGGNSLMRFHAGADNRDARDVFIERHFSGVDGFGNFPRCLQRFFLIDFGSRKRNVRVIGLADVLNNDVDIRTGFRNLIKNLGGDARLIRHRTNGDLRF